MTGEVLAIGPARAWPSARYVNLSLGFPAADLHRVSDDIRAAGVEITRYVRSTSLTGEPKVEPAGEADAVPALRPDTSAVVTVAIALAAGEPERTRNKRARAGRPKARADVRAPKPPADETLQWAKWQVYVGVAGLLVAVVATVLAYLAL